MVTAQVWRPARADLGDVRGREPRRRVHGGRHLLRPRGRVPELAGAVAAPAVRGPRRRASTGVRVSGGDLHHVAEATHEGGGQPPCVGVVAELARAVGPPAVDLPAGGDGAGVCLVRVVEDAVRADARDVRRRQAGGGVHRHGHEAVDAEGPVADLARGVLSPAVGAPRHGDGAAAELADAELCPLPWRAEHARGPVARPRGADGGQLELVGGVVGQRAHGGRGRAGRRADRRPRPAPVGPPLDLVVRRAADRVPAQRDLGVESGRHRDPGRGEDRRRSEGGPAGRGVGESRRDVRKPLDGEHGEQGAHQDEEAGAEPGDPPVEAWTGGIMAASEA